MAVSERDSCTQLDHPWIINLVGDQSKLVAGQRRVECTEVHRWSLDILNGSG
jgi:hypothetical protein